jgi:hypothetical protein
LTLSLGLPRSLGSTVAKFFLGVGLALPVVTGVLSLLFVQEGLINKVEVYPWDQILSVLFFLALFVTPESICVYLFQKKIIKGFLARMAFLVVVVFLYGNYIFLPASVYTVLPEAAGTLVWALWPPIAVLVLGFVVGKVESRQVLA